MNKKLLSLAVIAALSTTTAFASDVRVSGFMNIVGGSTDSDTSYMGYDKNFDFNNETSGAIQFSSSISDNMSAVIQLVAKNDPINDNLKMEWGYVSYDATDEIRILAGRIRPALFLYSDYLDVGYAYNWITPPSEVYDQASITNLDGVNIAYNLELGDNMLSITGYTGNTSFKKVNPNDASTPLNMEFDNIAGGEIAFSNDYAKLRVGYIKASVTEDTTLSTAPSELKMDEADASFMGVGLSVDYADILFTSEYAQRIMDETGSADVTSYYAMLGYRIGDYTPSVTYAVADSDMEFSKSADATVAGMVNTVRAGNLDDRSSSTIALRYEVNPQAALKFEYNMATITTSNYVGTTTLNESDEDINTMRVALSVIF